MEISLEKIFYDYVLDEDFVDSEEYIDAVELTDDFLDNHIVLDNTVKSELDDLIGENRFIAQRQGFINGFRYAVKMMKEVYQG